MKSQKNRKKNGRVRTAAGPGKGIVDKTWGNLCIFYLLLTLGFLSWQLFDTWISDYFLLKRIGYGQQSPQTLRLIAFTVIAGALGGVVNGLRSSLHYHDRFDRQHAWKYLCAPWMGATLALFVYALLRSSVAVLGGDAGGSVTNTQVLSNFSVGALVGYGSKDVFVWLDDKVNKVFRVVAAAQIVKAKKSRSPAKNRKRIRTGNQNGHLNAMPPDDPVRFGMSANGRSN